jgi:hypothetical protein
MDTVDTLASLFVSWAQFEDVSWLWPPWVEVWHVRTGFWMNLELMNACSTLADSGSIAVCAGITTTDNQDVLATRIDWVLYGIPGDNAILAGEVVHRKVNAN